MNTPTERQGQFLAYIYQYSVLNGCAPAEADMQRFFDITPPSVHSMILMLEKKGYISRTPGVARSIRLNITPDSLPALKPKAKEKNERQASTISARQIAEILKIKAIFKNEIANQKAIDKAEAKLAARKKKKG